MNITRNNYEDYFLLYVDNELGAVERQAIELFVQENPDLRKELLLLQESVLRADKRVLFDDKASLLKNSTPANPVNETNFEEYFLLYIDDELNNEEKDLVEQFVYKHPQHQAVFELFEKLRFTPDNSVVFPDKQTLYRSEKDERVVVMRWWRIAAAAVLLLFIGVATWYFSGNINGTNSPVIAIEKVDTPSMNTLIPEPGEKDNIAQTIPADKITGDKINSPVKGVVNAVQIPNRNKNKEQRPALVKNINREKIKSETGSNIRTETIVKPTEIAIARVPDERNESTEETNVNKPDIIDVAIGLENSDKNDSPPNVTYANNTNDRIEVLNTSISNKTKMRGFFRKVGRVVDKATNFGNDDNSIDKKGLRIANFEIALK